MPHPIVLFISTLFYSIVLFSIWHKTTVAYNLAKSLSILIIFANVYSLLIA